MPVRERLSLLWVFLTVNFLFCDVFSLFLPDTLRQLVETGGVDGIAINERFLLGFAVIMEVPLAMIVAARLLPDTINRWANIGLGILLIIVQVGSLMSEHNTLHYLFFSVIEIGTLLWIVATAWGWRRGTRVA